MENVHSNHEAAMEFNPESFGRVVMLYIDSKVSLALSTLSVTLSRFSQSPSLDSLSHALSTLSVTLYRHSQSRSIDTLSHAISTLSVTLSRHSQSRSQVQGQSDLTKWR